jgi:hypothetical protein
MENLKFDCTIFTYVYIRWRLLERGKFTILKVLHLVVPRRG